MGESCGDKLSNFAVTLTNITIHSRMMNIMIASNTVDLPGMYNRRMAEKNTVRLLNQFVLLYSVKLERNTCLSSNRSHW